MSPWCKDTNGEQKGGVKGWMMLHAFQQGGLAVGRIWQDWRKRYEDPSETFSFTIACYIVVGPTLNGDTFLEGYAQPKITHGIQQLESLKTRL